MKTSSQIRPSCSVQTFMAALVGLGIAAAMPLQAQITLSMPNVQLLPNTPNQTFDVSLASGTASGVTGIDLNVQIADGGTAAGGSINGPSITLVDILTGTVFQSNNNGLSGTGSIVPQIYEVGTLTSAGSVSLPGTGTRVARVTVDTTGFFSSPLGGWALTLNTLNGPAKYTTTGADLFPTMQDGSLTIVPEPGTYAFMAGSACLVFAGVRRRFSK